ncbi:MAG: DUF5916 domain-containing protein [Vicinamibacterales bacterium]
MNHRLSRAARIVFLLFFFFLAAAASSEAGQVSGPLGPQPPSAAPDEVMPVLPFAFDGPAPPMAPAVVARDGAGRITMRAVRLTTPLRIDGALDEAFYTQVPAISDFVQTEPRAGADATEKTEVWVAFDDKQIYVSFRCYESQPERLVGNEMRRDSPNTWNGDDMVSFILDTFYDRRNPVHFAVNPIGGRQDAQITNERQWGGDWNPVWEVKVAHFEGGWSVEAAIPFKSLRYRPGRAQIWGFNAFRTNRWKNELSFLAPIPPGRGQQGLFLASRAATLVGLEAPLVTRNLEVKPYITSNLTSDAKATPVISNDPGGDVGLDAKLAITRGVTADLTVNTDFSQVEADEQQINLTRFSLFFPEKREFFLENQGTFGFGGAGGGGQASGDTPILFYSRSIGLHQGTPVPIAGGGRVSGRLGRYTLGVLNIQTTDEANSGAPATNFSAVRIKRDVLRRSSFGLILTERSVGKSGLGSNAAYGLDASFGFFDNLSINTYWARTDTTGARDDNTSYRGEFNYNGDRYGLVFDRLVVGDHFNPEIGFLRRDDIQRNFGSLRFSPRPKSLKAVRKFSWSGSGTYIENGAGRLEGRTLNGDFSTEFQTSDTVSVGYANTYEFVPVPSQIASVVTIPAGGYKYANVRAGFGLARSRRVSAAVDVDHGTFYGGDRTAITVSRGKLNVSPQLSLEPTYSVNWLDLPQGSFTTQLTGSRITYTVTPLMFVSSLVQYNSAARSVSANVRLRWEYQPGSEIFIVFNEQRDTATAGFPGLANRAFIVKINRLFRI